MESTQSETLKHQLSPSVDTARGLGSGDTQRFGVLYSNFEFAVQDVIKTPKLKPTEPETLLQ